MGDRLIRGRWREGDSWEGRPRLALGLACDCTCNVRGFDVQIGHKQRFAMLPEQTRTARLEARITPDALAVVRRAADLEGRSVSDFVVTAAREAARKVIEDAQIIRLSVEDQRSFAAAILDPPPLAPAMERAIARHRALITESR